MRLTLIISGTCFHGPRTYPPSLTSPKNEIQGFLGFIIIFIHLTKFQHHHQKAFHHISFKQHSISSFICIFQKTAVTNQDLIYKHHFASPHSHCLFTTTMRYQMKTSYGSDAVTSSCGLQARWLQILGFLLCFWLRKRKVEAPRQRGPESVEQEMGNEKLEQMQVWDVIVYNAKSA